MKLFEGKVNDEEEKRGKGREGKKEREKKKDMRKVLE